MADTTRRGFLKYGIAGAALSVTAARPGAAAAAVTTARAGGRAVSLRPFAEPLPVPGAGIVVATPAAPGEYAFTLRQIHRRLHPQLPPTPLWAYDDGSGLGGQAGSFGMAIVAQTGTPLQVSYTHRLPGDLPVLDPGRHPADAAGQPGADDDPPARRVRRGRQRRQPGGHAGRVRSRARRRPSSTRTRAAAVREAAVVPRPRDWAPPG